MWLSKERNGITDRQYVQISDDRILFLASSFKLVRNLHFISPSVVHRMMPLRPAISDIVHGMCKGLLVSCGDGGGLDRRIGLATVESLYEIAKLDVERNLDFRLMSELMYISDKVLDMMNEVGGDFEGSNCSIVSDNVGMLIAMIHRVIDDNFCSGTGFNLLHYFSKMTFDFRWGYGLRHKMDIREDAFTDKLNEMGVVPKESKFYHSMLSHDIFIKIVSAIDFEYGMFEYEYGEGVFIVGKSGTSYGRKIVTSDDIHGVCDGNIHNIITSKLVNDKDDFKFIVDAIKVCVVRYMSNWYTSPMAIGMALAKGTTEGLKDLISEKFDNAFIVDEEDIAASHTQLPHQLIVDTRSTKDKIANIAMRIISCVIDGGDLDEVE